MTLFCRGNWFLSGFVHGADEKPFRDIMFYFTLQFLHTIFFTSFISLSLSLSLCYTYHSPPSCFSLTQGNHFTQINNKPPILTASHKQINNGFFRRWLRHHLDTWDTDYRTGDETAYKYRNATHTEKLPSNNIYFLMCKFRHCAGVLKKCWIQTFRKCKNWNPSC